MSISDQIRALIAGSTQRAEAATPGPWKTIGGTKVKRDDTAWPMHLLKCDSFDQTIDATNADFIAAARTDLPRRDQALLADRDLIAQLRRAIEPLAAQIRPIDNTFRRMLDAIDANETKVLALLQ